MYILPLIATLDSLLGALTIFVSSQRVVVGRPSGLAQYQGTPDGDPDEAGVGGVRSGCCHSLQHTQSTGGRRLHHEPRDRHLRTLVLLQFLPRSVKTHDVGRFHSVVLFPFLMIWISDQLVVPQPQLIQQKITNSCNINSFLECTGTRISLPYEINCAYNHLAERVAHTTHCGTPGI